MELLSFPDEILEEVVDNIEAPLDLLHFGLTCKRIQPLTIPCPLQYRQLVWPTHDGRMGQHSTLDEAEVVDPNPNGDLGDLCAEHLLEEPRRAKAVRVLTVTGEGTKSAPVFLRNLLQTTARALVSHPNDRYSEEWQERHHSILALSQVSLAKALAGMSNLQEFAWDWADPAADGPLWAPLSRITSLTCVSFHLYDYHLPSARRSSQGQVSGALLERIAATAKELPNLQVLLVSVDFFVYDDLWGRYYPTFDASPFLTSRYPELRAIRFEHVRGSAEDVSRFVDGHPLLHVLGFDDHIVDLSLIGPDAVPELTHVIMNASTQIGDAQPGSSTAVLLRPLSSGSARPIQMLSVRVRTDFEMTEMCALLQGLSDTLSDVRLKMGDDLATFKEEDLEFILRTLPHLYTFTFCDPSVAQCVQGETVRFASSHRSHLERWAGYFVISSSLVNLSLFIEGMTIVLPKALERLEREQPLELETVFARVAPHVQVEEVLCIQYNGLVIKGARSTST